VTTKISETTVKPAVLPATGSTSLWDEEITGFGFRVHGKGTKSFFFDYRHNGQGKRLSIGKHPAWTATQARARAAELRRLVDAGGDPQGEKRERRDEPTIKDLVERYRRDHLPTLRNVRPQEADRVLGEIKRVLGKDVKVASVHYGDLEAMHKQITRDRGPVRANRILACASVMFNMALRPLPGEDKPWRNAVDGNPARGIKKNHEEPAGRLYSPTEMAAIADALATYRGRIAADCITLVMLTGSRPCEAQRALWSEFEEKRGFWCKPSSHTKQKRKSQIPLSPPARQLVERLWAKRDPGATVVFPGRGPGGTINVLQHCWRYVRERAELPPGARLYDTRHSFASIAAGGGASLLIIGRLLGHTTAKTTLRYAAHLSDDPLQAVTNMVAGKITGDIPDSDNVVSIGRRP